jgi:hypothetical protein
VMGFFGILWAVINLLMFINFEVVF